MPGELNVLNFIKEVFPFTFISLIDLSIGYAMGIIISKIRIKHVDDRVKQLEDRISKTH